MNSRRLQERLDFGDVKTEWEECSSVIINGVTTSLRYMSDKEVTALVRQLNKENKANGSYVRYRSTSDESGFRW